MKSISPEEVKTLNKDLIWSLSTIQEKETAVRFFASLKDCVCVYSPSVEILYTNFEVIPIGDFNNGLVMLPNMQAYHDQFYRISTKAIAPIKVAIVPGKPYGKEGFLLLFANGKVEEFKRGLMKLHLTFKKKNLPFLPVVQRGDLREVNSAHPCLYLHVLKPSLLSEVSDLDKKYLQQAVTARFENIARLDGN